MEVTPSLGFWGVIKKVFENFCDISGRTRRREYWLFILFFFLLLSLSLLLALFFLILGIIFEFIFFSYIAIFIYNYSIFLFPLILLISTITVTIRRLHDTGRSGYYILLGLIPIIGEIILIIFLSEDSQKETNLYGPSSKYLNLNEDILSGQGNYIPPQGNIFDESLFLSFTFLR